MCHAKYNLDKIDRLIKSHSKKAKQKKKVLVRGMRSLDFWLFLRQIRQNLLTLFTLFTSSPCFTFFQSFISQTCLTSIPCTRQYPKFCLPFLLLDLSPNLSHNSHVRSTRFGRRPENRADVCAARRCGVALQDDVRLRKVRV